MFNYSIDLAEQTKYLSIDMFNDVDVQQLIEQVKSDYRCDFKFAIILTNQNIVIYSNDYGIVKIKADDKVLMDRFNFDLEDVAYDFENTMHNIISQIEQFNMVDDEYLKVDIESMAKVIPIDEINNRIK